MANVLITGCSSGFGLLTALHLGRKGHRVVATMRRPERDVELARAVRDEHLPIAVAALDVCDPAQVTAAVANAQAEHGPLDVLINNAGIELRSSIEDAGEDDVRRQFETNVFGAVRVMQAVLPTMRERRSGTIVNVSSIAGVVSRPYGGFYAASKHALEAISEALHYEVAPFGIRVALVEPGQFATNLLDNAWNGARFTPASPYWARSEQFDRASRPPGPRGRARGARRGRPADRRRRTRRAVWLPPSGRRGRAHDRGGYRQADFESFEQAMRQALDWWD